LSFAVTNNLVPFVSESLKAPESVFERLYQTARKRKTNMSILAGEILDRNLPHFEIKQLDKPLAAD